MVRTLLVCVFVMTAASVYAQTPYVAGTIGADVVRSSHSESNFGGNTEAGSEILSGSLRVGTSVGENWGVELEFVRSGERHDRISTNISPLAASDINVSQLLTMFNPREVPVGLTVPVAFASDVRESRTDYDATAWVRQRAANVDLIYLGGIAFTRQRAEITQTFPTVVGVFAPVPNGSFRTTVIDYAVHPLVGAEARIGLTSHMKLLPGIRLQGLSDGWLLRPYVGLGWSF
jgi:hypothetical protein